MLDEYSEDFGTNFEEKIPESQRQQIKGNPTPYQNGPMNPNYQQNSHQNIQQPIYQQQDPRMNYQQYQQPVMPYSSSAPSMATEMPSAQAPNTGVRSRLDGIFGEESQDLKDLLRAEQGEGCVKKIFFVVVSIAVIVVSFWGSFVLGKKIFLPESTDMKNEIPAFLTKKSSDTIKSTFDSVRKIAQTDDLFKNISPQANAPKVVPPEVRPIRVQKVPIKTYTNSVRDTEQQPAVKKSVVKTPPPKSYTSQKLYRVIAGSYPTKQQAKDAVRNLKIDGFECFIYQASGEHRIQIGAFKSKDGATEYMKKAQEYGYNAFISIK